MASSDGEAHFTRRQFAAAAAALAIAPRAVLGGPGPKSPHEKLNIAAVGIGGMGGNYVAGCASENIVALCDVDDGAMARLHPRYPKAKTYRDYRVMLDQEKDVDAVIIGTPDHTHAVIAMAAMRLGKHVYCAKPLTRTLHEARALTETARQMKVATQMSVQSCASEDACATAEWVRSGIIGPVREVHVWTDRPIWPQALPRPTDTPPVPAGLDWDLWLGPAPARPYHPIYHPFRFRGWVDFGTGALGDMACHSFHVIFQALKLGQPVSAQASVPSNQQAVEYTPGSFRSRKADLSETYPAASIVTWDFPARGDLAPVRMTWYDGGLTPPRPRELPAELGMPTSGLYFVGDRGVLWSGFSGGPRLLSESLKTGFVKPPKTLPRTTDHYGEWIAAAKGGPPAACNFEFGGLLTETALLGVIAQRVPGELLAWDAANLRISNNDRADKLVNQPCRAGWSL
jgi:predicted dehydrogenase